MTISFPAFKENGVTSAWWLNNGLFSFRSDIEGNGFSLMPDECNFLIKEAKKYLGCKEPVVIFVKDKSDPEISILENNIIVKEKKLVLTYKNVISYDRFLQLVTACFKTRRETRDNVIQPLIGMVNSLYDSEEILDD